MAPGVGFEPAARVVLPTYPEVSGVLARAGWSEDAGVGRTSRAIP